ncbi:uncharacterized protein T551_03253 [Pneumocystis jirovecii RU7]|uniref:Uncharacterized protein n=1 Tax=Pneumocystis jirovecii (strain RU7) TaxID=1408657 RepID=A0A0W4ZFV5_PNEJ7|nr:uncharacterized protein T551_03253 [Pneumocystis jirovecii RU7]KTW27259.1 hypothetical protein T551_03253 [Pneumocystis jirovecii RU7]
MQKKDPINLCSESLVSQTPTKESSIPRNIFSKARAFFSPSIWKQNSYENRQDEIYQSSNFKNENNDNIDLKNHSYLQENNIIEDSFFKKIENQKTEGNNTPSKPLSSETFSKNNINIFSIDPTTPKMDQDILSNKISTPNEILSSFFSKKGNSPLNTVEIEGVISLMSKNTTSNIDFSSFITPLKAQQSTFSVHNRNFVSTPDPYIKFGSSIPTFSRSKTYSIFGPTISTPFRKRKSTQRSSFRINNISKHFSPSKYDLLATIDVNENQNTKSGNKHELDITLAPEAKRRHLDSVSSTSTIIKEPSSQVSKVLDLNIENFIKSTKTRTATNILNILDKKEKDVDFVKTKLDIQSTLSPYASPSTSRRAIYSKNGSNSNIINLKKQKSIAGKIEETMYLNASSNYYDKKNIQGLETSYKKYKPTISSNLQNVISIEAWNEDNLKNYNTKTNNSKNLNIFSSELIISKNFTEENISANKNLVISQSFETKQKRYNSLNSGFASESKANDESSVICSLNDRNKHTVISSSNPLNQKTVSVDESLKIINKSLKHEIYKIDINLLPQFSFTMLSFKEIRNEIKNISLIPEMQLYNYNFTIPI